MRLLYLMFFLASFPLATFAADMKSIQSVVGPQDVLRGRFSEEKDLQGFKEPMKSEGHFVVAPHYGIIWALDKPFTTTMVITRDGLVQSINGSNVMRLPSQKIPFMLHLYDALGGALTGDWVPLEADFVVTQSGNAKGWNVSLVPRQPDNPAMPFSSITIKGRRFVESVVMLKPNGDSDRLTFMNESVASVPPTVAEIQSYHSVQP